jgi:glutaredoxin
MMITIYSTTTCPYCKALKDYLEAKGVPFVEKMVDSDEAAKEEMSKHSNGFFGVPFTLVTLGDGRQETIIGFDKGKIDSLLNPQG